MNENRLADADRAAFAGLIAVDPVWSALISAREAVGLADRVILHAGPPFSNGRIAAPVLNSAAMAALYEGWASSEEEAVAMLRAGDIELAPAQDRHVVVPLASVLSPSMQVHVVEDARNPGNRTFAPINGGAGAALRLGMAGAAVVDHLRWLNGELAGYLRPAAAGRIALIPIADEALSRGDDCHGRTVEGSRILIDRIAADSGAPAGPVNAFLDRSPSFFLNLWMAACKCMLAGAEGHRGSSTIIAIGGNGIDFGIQVSGLAGRWFTMPAEPPEGRLDPGFAQDRRLGAIGDSAIVDALGLGAMAMHHAPAQREALQAFMPEPSEPLGARLMSGAHEGFRRAPINSGLAARRVVGQRAAPAIALGILDREGREGRIGGGIYLAPLAAFAEACAALDGPQAALPDAGQISSQEGGSNAD